jgi:hypothetical protein
LVGSLEEVRRPDKMLTHAKIDSLEKKARKQIRAAHARLQSDLDAWMQALSPQEMAEFWTRFYLRLAELGVIPHPPANLTELQLAHDPAATAYDEEAIEAMRSQSERGRGYEIDIAFVEVWQAYKAEGHPASHAYRYGS